MNKCAHKEVTKHVFSRDSKLRFPIQAFEFQANFFFSENKINTHTHRLMLSTLFNLVFSAYSLLYNVWFEQAEKKTTDQQLCHKSSDFRFKLSQQLFKYIKSIIEFDAIVKDALNKTLSWIWYVSRIVSNNWFLNRKAPILICIKCENKRKNQISILNSHPRCGSAFFNSSRCYNFVHTHKIVGFRGSPPATYEKLHSKKN